MLGDWPEVSGRIHFGDSCEPDWSPELSTRHTEKDFSSGHHLCFGDCTSLYPQYKKVGASLRLPFGAGTILSGHS